MAERRMFAKTIIDSDAFLDMPITSQLLYFHLAMRADDDGFVNKPKSLMRMVGCHDDDLKLLFVKKFLIPFESGVVVIKHWKIHNYIRKDTYTETKYKEEKSTLELDENSAYRIAETNPLRLRDESVTSMSTQVRLGKDSIGKVSVGEDSIEDVTDNNVGNKPPKAVRHKYGLYEKVLLTDEDYEKLKSEFPHDYSERIARLDEYIASTGKKYKNHLATIRSWARKDKPQSRTIAPDPKSSNPFLDMLQEVAYE